MAIGFGMLGLAPAAFWTMTPRELAAALKAIAPETDTTMDRGALAALMRRHPDR